MPRLTHNLLRQARVIDPLLPWLLRPCRDLTEAQNELRWLRESLLEHDQASRHQHLKRLCIERSRGKPLQYILGNQPFGDLDICCRPGVLIPRPETESYTTFLARYLRQIPGIKEQGGLRILDLCTGTGCISLLLHSLLDKWFPDLQIQGIDISKPALELARYNLMHNVKAGHLGQKALFQVRFDYGDVLDNGSFSEHSWDIVVSNPPYISETSFGKDTSRSARIFEPKLALVPRVPPLRTEGEFDLSGDVFYEKITEIAERAKAKVVVMEVADEEQAQRVLQQARGSERAGYWKRAMIWHDNLYNAQPVSASQHGRSLTQIERVGIGKARAAVLTTV